MSNKEAVKLWRKRTKERMVLAMGGKCVCCGYDRCVEALDFHHLDPSAKEIAVGATRANPTSWSKIVKELRKCVLLCAICHREYHAGLRDIPDDAVRFDETYAIYEPLRKANVEACPVCRKEKPIYLVTCSRKCAAKRKGKVNWDLYDVERLCDESASYEEAGRKVGCTGAAVKKRLMRVRSFGDKLRDSGPPLQGS